MRHKCRKGDLALLVQTSRNTREEDISGRLVRVHGRGADDPEWGPTWVVTSIIEDEAWGCLGSVADVTLPPGEAFCQPDVLLMPFGASALSKWAAEQVMKALEEVRRVQSFFFKLALDEECMRNPSSDATEKIEASAKRTPDEEDLLRLFFETNQKGKKPTFH